MPALPSTPYMRN
jgi:transposase